MATTDKEIPVGKSVTVSIVGTDRVRRGFILAPGIMHAATRRSLLKATAIVRTRTQLKLTNDVLNIRTGNLRRSIFREIDGHGTAQVGIVAVGTTAPYGRVHELGLGKMPERSFLRSSLSELEPAINRIFRQEVDAAVTAMNPFPGGPTFGV